jgi:hypothetical protein
MSDSPGMSGTVARPPTLRNTYLAGLEQSTVDAYRMGPFEPGVAADEVSPSMPPTMTRP